MGLNRSRKTVMGKVGASRGPKSFKEAELYFALSRRSRMKKAQANKRGKVYTDMPRIRSTARPDAERFAEKREAHLERQRLKNRGQPGILERFLNRLRDLFPRRPRNQH